MLILHQKAKHFKCLYCPRRLNSASGLVVHIAQIHKETVEVVPNSISGHDSPEIEIFGMQGVPPEDIQRHYDGLPIVPYKKSKLGEAGLVSLLAAQKAATSGNPLPMSIHVPLKQVQIIEGIGPSQAIPRLPSAVEAASLSSSQVYHPVFSNPLMNVAATVDSSQLSRMPMTQAASAQPSIQHQLPSTSTNFPSSSPSPSTLSFTPIKIDSFVDQKSGRRQPTSFVMIHDAHISPVPHIIQSINVCILTHKHSLTHLCRMKKEQLYQSID